VEAIRMNRTTNATVDPLQIVDGQALLIAGLSRTHRGTNAGMPAQWQEFTPYLGHIAAQASPCTYGVLYNDAEGSIDYLTGVEVKDFASLPVEFAHLRIPAQHYAVFAHAGHVSTIGDTWGAIWSDWFPRSGQTAADAPMFDLAATRRTSRRTDLAGRGGTDPARRRDVSQRGSRMVTVPCAMAARRPSLTMSMCTTACVRDRFTISARAVTVPCVTGAVRLILNSVVAPH
jgi:predicted transcriptional regulator YdeE